MERSSSSFDEVKTEFTVDYRDENGDDWVDFKTFDRFAIVAFDSKKTAFVLMSVDIKKRIVHVAKVNVLGKVRLHGIASCYTTVPAHEVCAHLKIEYLCSAIFITYEKFRVKRLGQFAPGMEREWSFCSALDLMSIPFPEIKLVELPQAPTIVTIHGCSTDASDDDESEGPGISERLTQVLNLTFRDESDKASSSRVREFLKEYVRGEPEIHPGSGFSFREVMSFEGTRSGSQTTLHITLRYRDFEESNSVGQGALLLLPLVQKLEPRASSWMMVVNDNRLKWRIHHSYDRLSEQNYRASLCVERHGMALTLTVSEVGIKVRALQAYLARTLVSLVINSRFEIVGMRVPLMATAPATSVP